MSMVARDRQRRRERTSVVPVDTHDTISMERCETCSDDPCGFLPPQRDDCAIVHAEVHEMAHDLADVPIRERQRRAICQDNTRSQASVTNQTCTQTQTVRASESVCRSFPQAWRMSC